MYCFFVGLKFNLRVRLHSRSGFNPTNQACGFGCRTKVRPTVWDCHGLWPRSDR